MVADTVAWTRSYERLRNDPAALARLLTEPERLLGAYELADRVCGVFGCPHYEHLSIPQEVA
jgi:hypothetical protein